MSPDRWVKTIAVLRPSPAGGLLPAVPALRALRAEFPEAEITLIALPDAESPARLLQPYVDRFVTFGGYPGVTDLACDERRSRRFMKEQRARGYDLVIQLHGDGEASNRCALALGGRATVGYYRHEAPAGMTLACPSVPHESEALRCLNLVRAIGCDPRGEELQILPETAVQLAAALHAQETGARYGAAV